MDNFHIINKYRMKKLLVIFSILIMVGCTDDNNPLIDNYDALYELDSVKCNYDINDSSRYYYTESYSRKDLGTSGTLFEIGTDTNEYFRIYVSKTVLTVDSLLDNQLYLGQLITPITIDGSGVTYILANTYDNLSYNVINDSTLNIELDFTFIPNAFQQNHLTDTIFDLHADITFYNSLK